MSRQYHKITTHYNIYFNGKESLKEGEEKIRRNYQENYCYTLPLFISDDDIARKSSYSNMERAVIKAQKAIKLHSITRKPKRRNNNKSVKYKQFRKKKEYNAYIDDCYLLIGKGNFYNKKYSKADKAFTYIIRQFHDKSVVVEAKIWYIRSLTEQKKYAQAKLLINSLDKEAKMSSSLRELYYKAKASYYIKSGNISSAINGLEILVNIAARKKERIRYNFILAQLYLENNMDNMANNLFGKIANMKTSYEMSFNASINLALAYKGQQGEEIRRNLFRMLSDIRNKEYRDQIYFALGNVELYDGNIEKGIEYYRKSASVSVNNDVQKSLSYRVLGDYYYKKKDYINAYTCYDSCVYFSHTNVEIEKELVIKKKNLSDLVRNLNVVRRQDSLQMLANMGAKQRDKFIQTIIDKIRDKEEKLLQEEKDALLDRSFDLQNGGNIGRNNMGNSQGGWYFYNPVSITMGRSEFIRKWGKRRDEDNWRRKNKAIVDIEDIKEESWEEDEFREGKEKVDLSSKQYYLKDIPLTKEAKELSDSLIIEALFAAADILRDKFKDYENSLKKYDELINRFTDNKYLIYSYYNSYKIGHIIGNYSKAEHYKKKLVERFPDSEYAKLVRDSDYLSKYKRSLNAEVEMYEKAYAAYSNYLFEESIRIVDNALRLNPKSGIRDRFLMLRALCVGRTKAREEFMGALKNVINSDPSAEIKLFAENLLKSLDNGAVPVVYGRKEIRDAKQLEKNRSWEFSEKDINEKIKHVYDIDKKDEFYVVLSIPREVTNVQRLKFQVNYIAEEQIEKGFVQFKKESFGTSRLLFIIKGLKNRGEATRLLKVLAESKNILNIVGKWDYDFFIITAGNYKILQYNQDIKEYVNFFRNNYLNDIDNHELIISQGKKGDDLFTSDMSSNHKFVLMYPSDVIKREEILKYLKGYDSDYTLAIERYDSKYDMAVVNNIGNRIDAIRYLKGFKTYYKTLNNDDSSLCKMLVITETNYNVFYTNKYYKEYLVFFDSNYDIDNIEILDDRRIKDGDFFFDPKAFHFFVIVYPVGINNDRLLNGFKKYNIEDLGLSSYSFSSGKEILQVSNLKDKKQGMMYFRAVITNRKLYRELQDKEYRNFVISKENLNILKKNKKLKEYISFFKKWYLNR